MEQFVSSVPIITSSRLMRGSVARDVTFSSMLVQLLMAAVRSRQFERGMAPNKYALQ